MIKRGQSLATLPRYVKYYKISASHFKINMQELN